MEENKKDQFDKIDELLKDTSAENRVKFNEDDAIDLLSSQEGRPFRILKQAAFPKKTTMTKKSLPTRSALLTKHQPQ